MAKEFWVIDSETDPFEWDAEIKPFIWGAYNGKQYVEFETALEMVEFFAYKNCYVYAHNGGNFDYTFFTDMIEYGQKISFINNRLSSFKIGEATFRDSWNILPTSLSNMEKMEFDYTKLRRDVRYKYMAEIREYLKSDCINLYKFVKGFVDIHGHKITLASAAFTYFFKQKKIKKPRGIAKFYDEFKKFYYGGRTECFQKGIFETNLTYLDINSAYPFVMSELDHPYGFNYIESSSIIDSKLNKSFIDIDCISEGALPFRNYKTIDGEKNLDFYDEFSEGLHFPHMKGRFFISGHEFKAGLETNTLKDIKINRVYIFNETINFKEYVDYFFKLKADSKGKSKVQYTLAKLFMNALYGKFAMNPNDHTLDFFHAYGRSPFPLDENKEDSPLLYPSKDMGTGQVYSCKKLPEDMVFYNICTAASITGAVRAFLHKSIKSCENVFYCDTDSIICEKHNLKISDKLGDWDIEGYGNMIGVGGKKMYAVKMNDGTWKTASKGVKFTHDEILRVCSGETVPYYNPVPRFRLDGQQIYTKRNVKMT